MKITKGKKLMSLVIAFVFCTTSFTFAGFTADKVYADDEIELAKEFTMIYYPKDKSYNEEWLADESDLTIDVKTATSTNSTVATLGYDKNEGYGAYYYIKTKAAGKATLTFNVKAAGSEDWVPWTMKVTVTKWAKPCKTFKVGKKNYTKKFKKKCHFDTTKKVSGKLVVKAAKGWKIISIEKYISKKDKWKNIKNKKKVTLKKYDIVWITYKKKGKDVYESTYIQRY